MSLTKLLIEVVVVALFAAPVALAETASPAAESSPVVQSEVTAVRPDALEVPTAIATRSALPSDVPATLEEVPVGLEPAVVAEQPAEMAMPPAQRDPAADWDESPASEPVSDAEMDEVAVESEPELEGLEPEPESDSVPASWDSSSASTLTDLPDVVEPEVVDVQPSLGAIGYDSEGRRGRVHIVVSRDTLWDISNAYLGTPWVWPSIWKDNDESIENPHLIHPGDHIWITPSEMRRVTPEEAALLLVNRPTQESVPAAAEDAAPDPAELIPETPLAQPVDRGSYRVSSRESAGLITPDQYEASTSIVGGVPERVLMSQEDQVYIGLGEGEIEAGDQLTIFRTNVKVFDPDTGALLGYHVEILGWLEVVETYPETSLAEIGMSNAEIEVSDRVMPREPLPAEIAIQVSPEDVEGKISFFPNKRVLMGFNDFVYLNRGSLDGLEVGSPLSVYRPGRMATEATRGESVHVPDSVIADMLVVRTEDQSAVALVTRSITELELGDRFRGAR